MVIVKSRRRLRIRVKVSPPFSDAHAPDIPLESTTGPQRFRVHLHDIPRDQIFSRIVENLFA